jgi:hypothetical protein
MSGRYGQGYDQGDDPRRQVSPRRSDGTRRDVRGGPHVGPLRLTPTRVFVAIALVGSIGYLVYSITVRDTNQIPLLASGAAILGIVFAALAVMGAYRAYRAGSDGSGGRAVLAAIAGGLAALVAFGAFATAAVLSLLWRG